MKDQDIKNALTAHGKTAPRVTEDDITAVIADHTFTVLPSGKVMVCEITLKNGYTVRGEAATVSKENFVEQIGREISYRNARAKIWELEGYLLQERLYEHANSLPEIQIAGFTLSYCDDRSAYLEADNRAGFGVSIPIDELSAALSKLHQAAWAGFVTPVKPVETMTVTDSMLDALDIPEGDMAARVVDREVSFGDDADCEGCKI